MADVHLGPGLKKFADYFSTIRFTCQPHEFANCKRIIFYIDAMVVCECLTSGFAAAG